MLAIDLTNRVAIITGSTQGTGAGIAEILAKAGCHIAGCSRKNEKDPIVSEFKHTIQKYNKKVFYKSVDLKNVNQIESFVEDVRSFFGRIDILVSNAGKNMFSNPEECDEAFWNENIKINLESHWLISKACKEEIAKNNGSIIIMTSNHAYSTLPGCFPYNVTKAGLTGLVKALAVEWAGYIRVNGIAPGFIETKGGDLWFDTFPDPEAKRKQIIDIHPVKKLGTPAEIGAICAFLASDYAGFITGTTVLVDGGRSALLQDV